MSTATPTIVSVGDITEQDVIIALMGPTGTGKSNFIDVATNQGGKHVGHALASCTSDVRAVRFIRNKQGREHSVVLVDTPGFDDTKLSDMEVLELIADWLYRTYSKSRKLSGIIYLHRITDNRMAGSPLANLRMFENLCGHQALKNVILVTTMWDELAGKMDVGDRRESELRQNWWKPMLDLGSSTERFNPSTYDTAWTIIDKLTSGVEEKVLLIQGEMVDLRKRLEQTHAGIQVYNSIQHLLEYQKEVAGLLRELAEGQNDSDLVAKRNAELNQIEQELLQTFDQVRQMRQAPLRRRIFSWYVFQPFRTTIVNMFRGPQASSSDSSDNIVIFLLGVTGSGKSTFINVATNSNALKIGGTLEPCTAEVQSVNSTVVMGNGQLRQVLFVDTPAPGGKREQKAEAKIVRWLSKNFKGKPPRDVGVLYMHQISDVKMGVLPDNRISQFESLCSGVRENIRFPIKKAIVTTMWCDKPAPEQEGREANIRIICPIVRDGQAPLCRFLGTRESAEAAVRLLLDSGNGISN